MKAMKGKSRPELSWEVCSPKISILPPVYIKREEILREELWIERERERTLTWWWERTHVHWGKEEQIVFQLRMKAEAATPKSVDERVPRDSSFVLIYRINPENQRLDRRERERERTQQTERTQPEWNFSGGLGDDHRSGGNPQSCGFWIWCVGLGGWGSWS